MKKTLLLLAVLIAPYAKSAEYFVATNGSSGNNGLTEGTPWPYNFAISSSTFGMIITMLDGTYTNQYLFDQKHGVTLRAKNKWKAVLANASDAGFTTCQLTIYGNSNTFDGLVFSNSLLNALGVTGASNLIKNCWFYNNSKLGIDMSAPGNSNNIIENCLIERCGGGVWSGIDGERWHGLYLTGPNNIVRNNVIRSNAGFGIHFSTSFDNAHMHNNRFYQNLTYGHVNFYGCVASATDEAGALEGTNYIYGNTFIDGLFLSAGAAYVTNNIILNGGTNSARNITMYGGNVPYLSNNFNFSTISFNNADGVVQGASDVTNSYVGFVNTNNGLYWLKDNSPARGVAKTTVFGPVDFFGNAQTQVFDIGAFQHTPALASDVRVLDPSPATGANYWQPYAPTTTGQQLQIGTVTIQNLRVQ